MSAAGRGSDPRYHKRRAALIESGRWRPYAGAEPVRDHVRQQMGTLSRAQVAEMAGVPESSVSKLLYDGRRRIRPDTAAALVAVTAAPGDQPSVGLVCPAGASHRLQALTARGWSPRLLAIQLGMHLSAVRRVRDGDRQLILAQTYHRVRELYDQLWDRPPPEHTSAERIAASKARGHAARHGWAPPMAWDEGALDDPAGRPAEGWRRRAGSGRPSAELAEDAADLFSDGYTTAQVAERMQISQRGLERAMARVHQVAAGRRFEPEAG